MAAILREIGKALGKAGTFLDDQRMRYHYGDDWKQKASFLQEMRRMEQEGTKLRLDGERQRQATALQGAEQAKQRFRQQSDEAILRMAESIGATTPLTEGVDTAGLPGSDLMGPPAPGAGEAAAAGGIPESFLSGASPEMRAIAQAVGAGTRVRTTEDRRSKRYREQTAASRAATAEARAAAEEGRQAGEYDRAGERHRFYMKGGRAGGRGRMTEAQMRAEARRQTTQAYGPAPRVGPNEEFTDRNDAEYGRVRKEWDSAFDAELKALRDEMAGGGAAPDDDDAPQRGDVAENDKGERLVFNGTAWVGAR